MRFAFIRLPDRVDDGWSPVAAKVCHSSTPEDRKAQLLCEARVMNALRHPNIVSLVAVITHSAPVVLAMELMESGDLRSYLRQCSLKQSSTSPTRVVTWPQLLRVAWQVASALVFLEDKHVVHRDIAARSVHDKL
jgi:serine/threonine protein kinase